MKKNTKFYRKTIYTFATTTALALGTFLIANASSNPGGVEDPLVTRSYLYQLLGSTSQPFIFTPVQVFAGQTIIGGEGTEIILRSGQGQAHVPGPDGIVNITSGLDMQQGASITANHFLIIPRADGRGVFALTDAWFLVKGDYEIVTR
ncbi:MAG: hypothetical protein FWC69_04360 [Defluviitaleaceae bacterium]|nr:hypothetical protein [Defluviitaleaceae bacterium]